MPTSPDPRTSLALRPREAARLIGVSERFLWDLTRTGTIPCIRLGVGKRRTVRYPLSALTRWLETQATDGQGNGKEVQA
jgi:excisionase family DNA binding protein